MPNTLPPTISLATLRAKADRAREVAQCDIRFFVALGKDNIGDIATCIGEPSFAGVKVFLGATTGELLTETGILERAIDALPVLFVFHAEDESVLLRNRGIAGPTPDVTSHHKIRPAQAAVEGARRIAALARPGMRLHVCHLSAADELRVLEETPGLTCEVAPHHLWFTADDAVPAGNLLKVNPPIRVESDRTALRSALADGAIAAVATDHAPHTLAEKSQPYLIAPSGVPGLDTMVPSTLMLVQQGCLSMARAVDALSTAPARILGLADRGLIAEGLRADMYLWNPSSTWTVKKKDLATRCGWSPFENIKLAGRPDGVWILGRRVA
jgi:dihydroorotase